MLVKETIKNEIYEKLINYAFKKSNAIMFISRKDGFNTEQRKMLSNTINELKIKFKDSFLKARNGANWVHTKIGYTQLGFTRYNDPPNFQKLFEVLFYKTTEEVKEYLLTNKDLYAWLNPEYPEDISFFKNGYCWLYSVAHEELCHIYCENEEEYNYLKSIGIKFVENNYTPIDKSEQYFENYND